MDTNTVKVMTEFGNKLDSYISVLAAKAGVAADHFYPVMVQQQVIEGWGEVFIWLLSIAGFISAILVLFKFLPKDPNETSPKQFVATFCGAIAGVLLFIVTCVNTGNLPSSIAKINNPEYYAVQALVKMVK